ncbi:hypothetical protein PAXRUDRAFT_829063 [Paxillus rubicundulus Ve08.2h10]|uniref:Uncharacterized protein n=1 Tax=Paxillus rubicundulus Ve08.2h10 TaxID=930991 RepID=A0A0D0E6J6_9AGAM|nr:hypothetical protein PAXRUDRAFT_829063 [Paxillus rubicundulus Ve08.2h10]
MPSDKASEAVLAAISFVMVASHGVGRGERQIGHKIRKNEREGNMDRSDLYGAGRPSCVFSPGEARRRRPQQCTLVPRESPNVSDRR